MDYEIEDITAWMEFDEEVITSDDFTALDIETTNYLIED